MQSYYYSKFPFLNKEEVPDATNWSVDEVIAYFTDKGFKDQAEEFHKQVSMFKQSLLIFSLGFCIHFLNYNEKFITY